MDERVRRTVETYERIADTYAEVHDDRDVVADLVERFVGAVGRAPERESDGRTDRPRVLDVGCGPGWESAAFADAGFDPVAFDLTRSFLTETRERAPTSAPVRGDMRALPFAADAFDGLWACASLLHVPESDVPETLAEFERVLAPGGVTLVSLKRADAPSNERTAGGARTDGDSDAPEARGTDGSPYDGDQRHFERYDPETVRELFANAGFDVAGLDAEGGWVAVTARRSSD